jgi:hypothetical protein
MKLLSKPLNSIPWLANEEIQAIRKLVMEWWYRPKARFCHESPMLYFQFLGIGSSNQNTHVL